MSKIKLGYAIEDSKDFKKGEPVHITPSHAIITGLTNVSGKSTCLEAMVERSEMKCIVFRTKIGEEVFTKGTVIKPYFKEEFDWQYVESLLEATMKERMKFERAWIIKASNGARSLRQVYENCKTLQKQAKDGSLQHSIYTTLIAYFDLVLPQLESADLSKTLTIHEGVNIMDLEELGEEVQSLVIRSVLEFVHKKERGVIVVMPESWRYIPQERGNPVKYAAEVFVRQGAVRRNFLFADSQDIAGTDKTILKQSSVWIMGLQTERNEVRHTIDQIPLPKKLKPKEDEIMTLGIGQFVVCTPRFTAKVYVQPSWMDDETARKISLGEITELPSRPEMNKSHPKETVTTWGKNGSNEETEIGKNVAVIQDSITVLKMKITELTKEIIDIKSKNSPKETELSPTKPTMENIDVEHIIAEVLRRMPVSDAAQYALAPMEMLKRELLEETKRKILQDISTFDEKTKRIMRYLESVGKGVKATELVEKALLKKIGGSIKQDAINSVKVLESFGMGYCDTHNSLYYGKLKNHISDMMGTHGASEQEVNQVYDHVIFDLLGKESKEKILA